MSYNARRISEIRSTHVINRDKLVYEYEEGKIAMIRYLDENGGTFRRSFLTYGANGQLMKIEWEQRKGNAGYEVDRVVSFIYYPDGNLSEMQDLRRSINGQQPDLVYIDRFENYDDKKNAEGFSLVHNDNEHLALLPGVVLQKNNPRKTIRSGDGVHYDITYTYTYNDKGWPVLKNGAAIFKNGPNEGETFTTTTRFTYY